MRVVLLLALVASVNALSGFRSTQKVIKGQFIIRIDETIFKTKEQVLDLSDLLETRFKIYVIDTYDFGTVKFLYVKGQEQNVRQAETLSGVIYIERNAMVQIAQQAECRSGSAAGCWGLDRTDQHGGLGYTDPANPRAMYEWGEKTGTTTHAYVADTGIDIDHHEFGGRAIWGYTAGDVPTDGDANGHGTHCAGTIGSYSYGLAKDVNLVAVKVLRDGGFGWDNDILDGLQWIGRDHAARSAALGKRAKSVVNISFGGGARRSIDNAVRALVVDGIVVVVAAGNGDYDACEYSPARTREAVTVGATDVKDVSANFTNYGKCVDLFAPGVNILSTVPNGAKGVFSGTSMAAPHVVGVVARYQDSLPDAPSPQVVEQWLTTTGTRDAIRWDTWYRGDSPNILLYGPCDLN